MIKILVFTVLFVPIVSISQPTWKKTGKPKKVDINLFHSTQTANLPTTQTLKKGDFMYEISHRFESISGGSENLFGLDGPVAMRTALSYGITDDLMLSLGRSNIQDNVDIRLRYKLCQFHSNIAPSMISVLTGVAFNTETFAGLKKRDAMDRNSRQYYAQLILNTMFFDKNLGIGFVPSFVYNSYIFANDYNSDKKYTFAIPLNLQFYFNRMWSIMLEMSTVTSGWNGNIYFDASDDLKSHNTLAFGTVIETGGHLFFLFVTNNSRLNPTQYLVGSNNSFKNEAWRLGFTITREF